MSLEIRGSGSILTEAYDGRQLELRAGFDIGGVTALDPQGADWEAQKLAFGRQVAIQVADEAVPQILAQLGISGRALPESGVNTVSDTSHTSEVTAVGGTALDVRQQIGGVFRLTGDRDMPAGDLVFAARDTIAEQIANVAVFAVEQRFENKQSASYRSSLQRRNGEIVSYERILKLQDPGQDADMVA